MGDRRSENPLSSSNSMHIDARHHFLIEMAASSDISVQYLRSEDQHADIRAKAIGRKSFERHLDFFWAGVRFQYFHRFLVDRII